MADNETTQSATLATLPAGVTYAFDELTGGVKVARSKTGFGVDGSYVAREPLITVNVLAAILLGIVVRVAEQYFGFAWDEFSLTAAGAIAVAVATWLARKGVWSPASHEQEVEAAYADGLGAQDRPGA